MIEMSLKFVTKVSMNNFPTLVQIMAWRRPGDVFYFRDVTHHTSTSFVLLFVTSGRLTALEVFPKSPYTMVVDRKLIYSDSTLGTRYVSRHAGIPCLLESCQDASTAWNYVRIGLTEQNTHALTIHVRIEHIILYFITWYSPGNCIYSLSQEICTRFCCALLCCGYAIVHNEFT